MKFGIIGDIHEDILSLKTALKCIEKAGCSEIICFGDIIGFSLPNFGHFDTRDASECISAVKQNCKYVVAGNHDLFPVRKIPKFDTGFNYPENWYDMEYLERKALAGEEVWLNEENELNPLISKSEKEYLRALPEYLVIKAKEFDLVVSHFLFPDLSGSHKQYYEAFGPIEPHLDFIDSNNALIGFSGHKHIEGFFNATNREKNYNTFGTYKVIKELQWIVGPCIVNGKKKTDL
ncbi:MAG: metallophosphoesterase [Bacteroidales bacterium]|nr:metallophosphoesterase [Bacteroidales bacterium]